MIGRKCLLRSIEYIDFVISSSQRKSVTCQISYREYPDLLQLFLEKIEIIHEVIWKVGIMVEIYVVCRK